MKKLISALLSLIIVMSTIAVPAMAKDNITVELDGREIIFDVQPQIINERTMVPLRAIFEALGASVEWNQENQMVTSVKGDKRIILVINNPAMLINGKSVVLDTPACVVDDRTLVPVRAISEAFDLYVEWDNTTRKVLISSKPFTSEYYTLKNDIIRNGEYNADGEYYSLLDFGDDYSYFITYNSEEDYISVLHGVTSDSGTKSEFWLNLTNGELPITMLEIKFSDGDKYNLWFEYENGNRKMLSYSTMPSYLLESALNLYDTMMKAVEMHAQQFSTVTLADFGIYY